MSEAMMQHAKHDKILSLMSMENGVRLSDGERTRVIAVASGKGGVGKTWMSVSLAHELARAGRRVLIVDGDFSLANVDLQLGLAPRYDLVDLLSGKCRLEDAIQTYESGAVTRDKKTLRFDVLPGRSGLSAGAGLERGSADRLLLSLRLLRRYDVIVLDLCAGIDAVTRHLSAVADRLVAVTTEEPTALADVYAVMKLYARDRRAAGGNIDDCQVVINQAASHRSGRKTFEKLFMACRSFLKWEPELAGCIRKDSRVPGAIRQQRSVVENYRLSPASVDIGRLTDTLLKSLAIERVSERRDLRTG
ncbi:AAA family ATPase [Neokomagataea anthophila]|uniref:AAA family ATPase n=1 Tax=Neokomagataea anthophila TaxID=2826925 RepID=A0ABS5E8N3_9PROT|nr:AAA family ATPase [Neokomagataea anthophila]MBR0560239.1 AAA family ATPase [Neokomagataea anthophila]